VRFSVLFVQLETALHAGRLLIIRRSWVRAPPAPLRLINEYVLNNPATMSTMGDLWNIQGIRFRFTSGLRGEGYCDVRCAVG
jgi:hypothetical protein